jgi:hypothetical protein
MSSKKYRNASKEKQAEYMKVYRETKREKFQAADRKYYETHKEKRLEYGKRYRDAFKVTIYAMVQEYLTTALWSSTDETTESGGYPLDDNYDITDVDDVSWDKATKECSEFYRRAKRDLKKIGVDIEDLIDLGHNFWLTKNGHGSGFWDGDYEEETGKILTDISKSFGPRNAMVMEGDREIAIVDG